MIYSVNEGQQAEEYKDKKAEEARRTKDKEADYVFNRGLTRSMSRDKAEEGVVNSIIKKNTNHRVNFEDYDKIDYLSNKSANTGSAGRNNAKIEGELAKRKQQGTIDKYSLSRARDAANRHMRRHPEAYKESCNIFSSVAFI